MADKTEIKARLEFRKEALKKLRAAYLALMLSESINTANCFLSSICSIAFSSTFLWVLRASSCPTGMR